MTIQPHVPVRASELIRKVLANNYNVSQIPDNHAVADEVFNSLDAGYRDSYLRLYIAQEVGLIANNMRNEAILRTKASTPSSAPTKPVQIVHTASGAPKASPATAAAVARGKKVIAAAVEEFLNRTIKVGGGVVKFVKDCTADDLKAAAQTNYTLAEQNQARGDMYTRIAEKMVKDKIPTVADVNTDELTALVKA